MNQTSLQSTTKQKQEFLNYLLHPSSHPWIFSIILVLFILILCILIMQIIVAVVYIKTSWFNRTNSKNLTGGDLTRTILDQEGMKDTKIVSSFFYAKYWNHSKRKNTFRLRPWTMQRSSIWTMTEAAQQTVVSTWRKQNGRMGMAFKIFRIPTFITIFAAIISITISITIFILFKNNGIYFFTSNPQYLSYITLIFLFIVCLLGWADVVKLSIIRKRVVPILKEQGFTDHEMKLFKLIYTSKWLLAIANAIYSTTILILNIIGSNNKK